MKTLEAVRRRIVFAMGDIDSRLSGGRDGYGFNQ
jgi:hypothetical protein